MKWNNIEEKQPEKDELVLVKMKDGTITGASYIDDSILGIGKGFYPVRIKPTKQYKYACECDNYDMPSYFDEKPKLWCAIDKTTGEIT